MLNEGEKGSKNKLRGKKDKLEGRLNTFLYFVITFSHS